MGARRGFQPGYRLTTEGGGCHWWCHWWHPSPASLPARLCLLAHRSGGGGVTVTVTAGIISDPGCRARCVCWLTAVVGGLSLSLLLLASASSQGAGFVLSSGSPHWGGGCHWHCYCWYPLRARVLAWLCFLAHRSVGGGTATITAGIHSEPGCRLGCVFCLRGLSLSLLSLRLLRGEGGGVTSQHGNGVFQLYCICRRGESVVGGPPSRM